MIAAAPAHQQIAPLCGEAPRGQISFRSEVVASAGRFTLADAADLSGLPGSLRWAAAALSFRTPRSRAAALETSSLAASARARMPILTCWLASAETGTISVRNTSNRSDKPAPRLPIAPWIALPSVQAGDVLALTVDIGAAKVERRVEAIQPAHDGQRLFVRDTDGKLLSVRYAGKAQ